MADRPMIFSAPMVRALKEGRKTQTRHIIKIAGRMPEYCGPRGLQGDPTQWGWEDANFGDWITLEKEPGQRMGWRDWRGAYAPGDRLWVKEAYRYIQGTGSHNWDGARQMRADGSVKYGKWLTAEEWGDIDPANRWISPIHMPRWASRITLTVTDVRVQRLQDITDNDAEAEGCVWNCKGEFSLSPREGFADLWNSLHGPGAWEANRWVSALTFDVAMRNIDEGSHG